MRLLKRLIGRSTKVLKAVHSVAAGNLLRSHHVWTVGRRRGGRSHRYLSRPPGSEVEERVDGEDGRSGKREKLQRYTSKRSIDTYDVVCIHVGGQSGAHLPIGLDLLHRAGRQNSPVRRDNETFEQAPAPSVGVYKQTASAEWSLRT